jgi:hypothetical protein
MKSGWVPPTPLPLDVQITMTAKEASHLSQVLNSILHANWVSTEDCRLAIHLSTADRKILCYLNETLKELYNS